MALNLMYHLDDPNFTIYHRAALGGLAATIQAWGDDPPKGVEGKVDGNTVRVWSEEGIPEREALRRLLAASFKLTDDKLVDLPGQGLNAGADDLRLAVHNGLCQTFLQHNKMRPSEKDPRRFMLKTVDEEVGSFITYKAINSYAHQKAQGTKLLDDSGKTSEDRLPAMACIPQCVVPGATGGRVSLQARTDEAILLLYLMVGCSVFLLRPRNRDDKAQACLVIPNVVDLKPFVRRLKYIAAAGDSVERFTNTYLGRIVGGAEEAALKFLIDIHTTDVNAERGVRGCMVVAMGKVAWDKNQINRTFSIRVRDHYGEMDVFRAALELGKSRLLKTEKGEGYAIPGSPIPELVAANLAAERHWCANFKNLIAEKKDFDYMKYLTGGLNKMVQVINNQDDRLLIQAFHQAWRFTMGELGERAERDKVYFERLTDVRREKIRNEIMRAKTADALANWFLRFCTDATKGNSLPIFREHPEQLRSIIFNPRQFERFQNLLLFALVSYKSETTKSTDKEA